MKQLLFISIFLFSIIDLVAIEPELCSEQKFKDRILLEEFIKHNNMGYFIGNDGVNGDALWAFDGEVGSLVKLPAIDLDITPKSVIVSTKLTENLLFLSTDSVGVGLWKTKGTEESTDLLLRIPNGDVDYRDNGVVVNGTVFFKILYTNKNIGIGFSDGTKQGSGIVTDSIGAESYNSIDLFSINNKLLIVMEDKKRDSHILTYYMNANRLYSLIDTKDYSYQNKNITYAKIGEYLLFTRDVNNDIGKDLWVTDGTVSGTHQLFSGLTFKYLPIDKPEFTIIFKGKLYFLATEFYKSSELWETDGTSEGTKKFKIFDTPYYAVQIPNDQSQYDKMVMITKEEGKEYKLMRTDGTNEGTKFYDLNYTSSDIPDLSIALAKDRLFYKKNFAYPHDKIWMQYYYDDSCKLIVDYSDISLARQSLSLNSYTINEKCLYSIRSEGLKYSLFATDGVVGEPTLVLEDSASLVGRMYYSKKIGNMVYFMMGGHLYSDLKLCRTDMTSSGSEIIQMENSTSTRQVYVDAEIIELNGYVYFFASYYKGHTDFQLYRIKSPVISNVEREISYSDMALVYPNPTSGIVNIDLHCSSQNVNYSIVNVDGLEFKKHISDIINDDNLQLDLTEYPPGVYFITVICENEKRTYKVVRGK